MAPSVLLDQRRQEYRQRIDGSAQREEYDGKQRGSTSHCRRLFTLAIFSGGGVIVAADCGVIRRTLH
jgi:hypothetical protein